MIQITQDFHKSDTFCTALSPLCHTPVLVCGIPSLKYPKTLKNLQITFTPYQSEISRELPFRSDQKSTSDSIVFIYLALQIQNQFKQWITLSLHAEVSRC